VVAAFYIKEARPQLIRNVAFVKCVSSFSVRKTPFSH